MEGPSPGDPTAASAGVQTAPVPVGGSGGDLRTFVLLQSLPMEVLAGLAASLQVRRFAAGEKLIAQGERAERMHFLRSGRVRVEMLTAGEVRVEVAVLGAGDCCGEMSLLTGEPASADVIAAEDAETLVLEREALQRLAAEHPGLLRDFTALIARRLRRTDEDMVSSRVKEQEVTRFLREDATGAFAAFVGKDRATRDIEKRVKEFAATADPVLILGERGTGKEMVARGIHYGGPRAAGPLLSVDCDRVTETQWGDSLFGDYHRRDGKMHPRGVCYMDIVEGGTLLLKNIEDLPPAVLERLGRFLEREGTGGLRRRDVRILATHRGTLGAGEERRGQLRALPAPLAARTLEIPPLRSRKRDIPALAQHFLDRHAARLGLGKRTLDDRALVKLVTHDYMHSNAAELEDAMRRSLVLSEGEVVTAEEVFLVRPDASRERAGILKIPRPLVRLAAGAWPGLFRAGVAVFFALLVLLCFLPLPPEARRWSLVLVWSLWWPGLAVSFLLLGRVWCSLCPMAFAGSWAQRFVEGKRPVPAWLKDREPLLLAGGFLLILWIEEVTDMRESPVATGILLLGILAGAVLVSLRWPRRTWCRHLCPLGGLAGACSTTSMVEVRSTPDICEAKCVGHSCYKGTDAAPGCPMFHHVMFLDTNRDCVLCLNCVRACPNESPRVIVTLPAQELWLDLRSRPEVGWIAALLHGLIPALALAQFWGRVHRQPFSGWLEEHRFPFLTALLGLFAAVPILLLRLRLPRGDAPAAVEARAAVFTRIAAWLPLLAAGFAAYQASFLPGAGDIETRLAWSAESGAAVSSPLLPVVQVALLAGGLLLSLVVLARQHAAPAGGAGPGSLARTGAAMGGAALWFVLVTGLLVGTTTAAALGSWGAAGILPAAALAWWLSLGGRTR